MTKNLNMTTFYTVLGLIGGIIVAISIYGYRIESGKSNLKNNEKASEERNEIHNNIKDLNELYKKKIQEVGLEYANNLSKKYPYGYALFGILNEEYVSGPIKFDSKLDYTADWKNTSLNVDPNNPENYILTIKNLKQGTGEIGKEFSGLFMGHYQLVVPRLLEEKAVEISFIRIENEARLFFELLDNSDPNRPVYLIGFKK